MELTVEEAGERYLEYVCASNASIDVYTRARDKFDAYTGSDAEPHPKTKKAAQKAADAHAATAQALADPEFVWPEPVRTDVARVARGIYEEAAWYSSIAEADTWSDVGSVRGEAKTSRAASNVRLLLGLAPRGECPDES